VIPLEFQGVSKAYGERQVLRELSFRIEAGERVVLHGPSGCGKSTVLRLLAGFVAPDNGQVRVGASLASADGRVILEPETRNLGMVFQDLALWPHLTVAGNLDFVLKARGFPADVRRARISAILEELHLQDFRDSSPVRLSGGQQQRVAIARAMISEPGALLMDEPLTSLDDELKEEVISVLLDLHAAKGFTLAYVTHSGHEIGKIGGRVIELRNAPPPDESSNINRARTNP
jgi:iron(III) transport system ATP-binding protein